MVLKNKKNKKCCSACDPASEVKRMECLRRPKRKKEWNACTAKKRKRSEVK
jgi:hypothetical protein